jgi:hypothetical protein
MIYIWFYLCVFLFSWYTAKLLLNTLTEEYWHIPQLLFLCAVFLMPYFTNYDWHYLVKIGCLALTYPLCFNGTINAYRKLPISHLGTADFLTFPEIVLCFCIGATGIALLIFYNF